MEQSKLLGKITRSPTERNISLAFQNLFITSHKDFDDRFESVIKTFQPKISFDIDEVRYRKRKRRDLTAIHEQIMKMNDTVIQSDVIESALKELLKQNVFSNHETSHGFDSFSETQKYSHQTIQLPKRNH